MRFWIVLLTVLSLTAPADGMIAETVDASAFHEEAAVPPARVMPAAVALARIVRTPRSTHELPRAPAGARVFRPPRA